MREAESRFSSPLRVSAERAFVFPEFPISPISRASQKTGFFSPVPESPLRELSYPSPKANFSRFFLRFFQKTGFAAHALSTESLFSPLFLRLFQKADFSALSSPSEKPGFSHSFLKRPAACLPGLFLPFSKVSFHGLSYPSPKALFSLPSLSSPEKENFSSNFFFSFRQRCPQPSLFRSFGSFFGKKSEKAPTKFCRRNLFSVI